MQEPATRTCAPTRHDVLSDTSGRGCHHIKDTGGCLVVSLRADTRHKRAPRRAMCLEIQACAEKREQLSREPAFVLEIGGVFAPEVVVQDAALGCFVKMRKAEIHVVSLDGGGHAADENDGPIGIDSFDDPDMSEGIVQFSISIKIPGVVKEHQISGMGDRALVEPAVLLQMGMDQSHAVRIGVPGVPVVQVDAVF